MRMNTFVEQEEVLAVVLEDVSASLTYSCAELKEVLDCGEWGCSRKISKDFLQPNATTSTISRGRNGRKRRCCVFILNRISHNTRHLLKRGKEQR